MFRKSQRLLSKLPVDGILFVDKMLEIMLANSQITIDQMERKCNTLRIKTDYEGETKTIITNLNHVTFDYLTEASSFFGENTKINNLLFWENQNSTITKKTQCSGKSIFVNDG